MVKLISLLLFLTVSLAVALPAEASYCRNSNDHSICILSIKRSAKNYWEYRVAISIDGVKKPIEVYNCRDRIKIDQDGNIIPFQSNSPGEIICSFFKK
ncbi:MAG: hypothetical protein F6K14_11370 [Symploca sp. SIO2C1]|nr:hypothetical protein [Symploca sp. SIO2C1]